MSRRLCPILCLALVVLSSTALAYNTQKTPYGSELRVSALPMRFNIHSAAARGVSAQATQAAVRAAYKAWTDVSCSTFTTQDQGVVNNERGNQGDGINTNTWVSGWPSNFPNSALGVTQTIYDARSGKIQDADTLYNPNYNWSVTGAPFAIDVQSVATHEIGHQLGLDHTPVQSATMFYATGQGDTSQRSLHSDDVAGICYLYPSGGTPPPECTRPEDCAPNETCQDEKCVPAGKKGYGAPCSDGDNCLSGICLVSAGNTFCSEQCNGQLCPNGDQCTPVQSNTGQVLQVCLPNSAQRGEGKLGDGCQNNLSCASQICVSVPGTGYRCSQPCDLNAQDCPEGFVCVPSSDGGGLCIAGEAPPKKGVGEACTDHPDCLSGLCGQTAAGRQCTQLCDDATPCPGGFDCVAVANTTSRACLRSQAEPQPGALGAQCNDHPDCVDGICAQDADGSRFCTTLCNPADGCPGDFSCVPAGQTQHVCKPPRLTSPTKTDGGSGGCTLGARPSPLPWLLLLLFLVGARARARE